MPGGRARAPRGGPSPDRAGRPRKPVGEGGGWGTFSAAGASTVPHVPPCIGPWKLPTSVVAPHAGEADGGRPGGAESPTAHAGRGTPLPEGEARTEGRLDPPGELAGIDLAAGAAENLGGKRGLDTRDRHVRPGIIPAHHAGKPARLVIGERTELLSFHARILPHLTLTCN